MLVTVYSYTEVLYLQPLIPPKRFDIFSPYNRGMLRRSRCVLIFLYTLLIRLGLYPFCFFFFFFESQALHRQLCSGICYFLVTLLLVLHIYAIFGVFASSYALFGGVQTSKKAFNRQVRYFMVVSGVHSSVVFNPCVYSSMYACMQSTLSVCIQQYDPETYLET